MQQYYDQLVLFEHLQSDKLIHAYVRLHTDKDLENVKEAYFYIVRTLIQLETTFEDYLIESMFASEHPVLLKLCKTSEDDRIDERDLACLKHDLYLVRRLLQHDLSKFCEAVKDDYMLLQHSVISLRHKPLVDQVLDFFMQLEDRPIFQEQCDAFLQILRNNGCGRFAIHMAYYVNDKGHILASKQFQPLPWDEIYDYEYQKSQIMANTKALVEGRPFHHVLLVGASGTGKSSSVKALIPYFEQERCRLIQLQKRQLQLLPKLLKVIVESPFRFILFIDDLSFEVNEDDYKFLKSFIEGGVINDASNVAFYVTSNRRHLIKEMRQEREQDIHLQDFIQEMTSLSDRFGMTLTYEPLTQKAYFDMVIKMCKQVGILLEQSDLETQARRWSLRHGGMSGRVAQQFVKHIQMQGAADDKSSNHSM